MVMRTRDAPAPGPRADAVEVELLGAAYDRIARMMGLWAPLVSLHRFLRPQLSKFGHGFLPSIFVTLP